jgi:hypothetical protein
LFSYNQRWKTLYIYLYSSYYLLLGILFCRILTLQFRKLIDRKNEWMASMLSCKKLALSKVWYLYLEKISRDALKSIEIVNHNGVRFILKKNSYFYFHHFLWDYNYITYHISSYATCTWAQIFAQGGLFMKQNANVPEGGNEGGRVATSTSISIFDSYDMKRWWFEFGHDIVNDFKMSRL